MPSPTAPPPSSYDGPATAEEAVMMTLVRLGRKMRQRLPGEDLDFAAIVLLNTLLHRGPMRLSALASVLHLDASTISRQVRQLEDLDLLARTTDPDDGRASQVSLTEQGRARLDAGAARRRTMVAALLEGWPATEREQLRLLLTRLLTDLEHDPET